MPHYAKALVEVMRSKPSREPPDTSVLALLQRKLHPDVAAYLDAWARHQAGFVSVGDWWHDAAPRGVTGGGISLGLTAGGDPITLTKAGKIVIKSHEGFDDVVFGTFDGFVYDRWFRANDNGNPTDIDALVGE